MDDDEFGDFSSAFPPVASSGDTSKSLGDEREGKSASFEKPSAFANFSNAGAMDWCPLTTANNMNFDAFASCAVPDPDIPAFANFSQVNVADIAIPHPDTVELGGSFFEIPPLPDSPDPVDSPVKPVAVGMANGDILVQDSHPRGSNDQSQPVLNKMPWGNAERVGTGVGGSTEVALHVSPEPTTVSSLTVAPSDSLDDFGEFETSLSLPVPEPSRAQALSQSGATSVEGSMDVNSQPSTALGTTSAGWDGPPSQEDTVAPVAEPGRTKGEGSSSQSQGDVFLPSFSSETHPSRANKCEASGTRDSSSSREHTGKGELQWTGTAQVADSGTGQAADSGKAVVQAQGGFAAFTSSASESEEEMGGFADFTGFQSSTNSNEQTFASFPPSVVGHMPETGGERMVMKETKAAQSQDYSEFGGFATAFPETVTEEEESQFGDFSVGVAATSSQSSELSSFSSHTQIGLASSQQAVAGGTGVHMSLPSRDMSNIVKVSTRSCVLSVGIDSSLSNADIR